MQKIMLVLDNDEDQVFLEKIMARLRYKVIAMRQGTDLSEQLIDHFPDVVFASTLGRNEKILSALGKIKKVRGKPKLVFVKQEKESSHLSEEQKKIIDGVLYSPIDPFKLIDVLAHTTDVELVELRKRYNEYIEQDRKSKKGGSQFVHGTSDLKDKQKTYISGSGQKTSPPSKGESKKEDLIPDKKTKMKTGKAGLIDDPKRSQKYKEFLKNVERPDEAPEVVDAHKMKSKQKLQSKEVQESDEVKKNRKHFLKTLFATSIEDINKKSS